MGTLIPVRTSRRRPKALPPYAPVALVVHISLACSDTFRRDIGVGRAEHDEYLIAGQNALADWVTAGDVAVQSAVPSLLPVEASPPKRLAQGPAPASRARARCTSAISAATASAAKTATTFMASFSSRL